MDASQLAPLLLAVVVLSPALLLPAARVLAPAALVLRAPTRARAVPLLFATALRAPESELARMQACTLSGKHLAMHLTTQAHELPPCVEACVGSVELVEQQCCARTQSRELELHVLLAHECAREECFWTPEVHVHTAVLAVKFAQLLQVPMSDVATAMVWWEETGLPVALEHFYLATEAGAQFAQQRLASARVRGARVRQYVAVRVDSARAGRSHPWVPCVRTTPRSRARLASRSRSATRQAAAARPRRGRQCARWGSSRRRRASRSSSSARTRSSEGQHCADRRAWASPRRCRRSRRCSSPATRRASAASPAGRQGARASASARRASSLRSRVRSPRPTSSAPRSRRAPRPLRPCRAGRAARVAGLV